VNRDPGNPTFVRCRYCGSERDADGALRRLARTYQVVVACGSCGTPFVALSRN